jgi:hypothetical protein
MAARDYFDHGGGCGFGAAPPRQPCVAGLGRPRVGLGDATSNATAALSNLQSALPSSASGLESQATALQSQAMSQLGGLSGQLASYQAQGQSIVNQATQLYNNPSVASGAALAAQYGVTLLNAASGSLGVIGRIAVGTIGGITAGLAVGGPIGAIAGGAFGFVESAITAITGSSSSGCTPPCTVSQPGWSMSMGTTQGDLIGKNLYMWRQTIGTETPSEKPVGYALYLAWTQLYPQFCSGRGYDPAIDTIAAVPFTATAAGLTALPDTTVNYTDTSLGYDASQRPPTGATVSTSRGPVGQIVFNEISDMGGGDTFAQLAITRLPPNSFLDPVIVSVAGQIPPGEAGGPYSDWAQIGPLPASAGAPHAALSSTTVYGGPTGFYAAALLTVLGHLTIGATDAAIASELQSQIHTINAAGLSWMLVPKHLALVQWYAASQGVGASTTDNTAATAAAAAASQTTAAAAGGAAAAALLAAPVAYALMTGKPVVGVFKGILGTVESAVRRLSIPRL